MFLFMWEAIWSGQEMKFFPQEVFPMMKEAI